MRSGSHARGRGGFQRPARPMRWRSDRPRGAPHGVRGAGKKNRHVRVRAPRAADAFRSIRRWSSFRGPRATAVHTDHSERPHIVVPEVARVVVGLVERDALRTRARPDRRAGGAARCWRSRRRSRKRWPVTAIRVLLLTLNFRLLEPFAGADRDLQPVLRRRERTLVGRVVDAVRMVRAVEVDVVNPVAVRSRSSSGRPGRSPCAGREIVERDEEALEIGRAASTNAVSFSVSPLTVNSSVPTRRICRMVPVDVGISMTVRSLGRVQAGRHVVVGVDRESRRAGAVRRRAGGIGESLSF